MVDHAGIYSQGGDDFVASLADEKESDINGETIETKTELIQETSFKEKRKVDMTILLFLFVLY